MAISARRSISASSLRRWAVASTDLAMVPPTRLKASDGKQILGNHTPAHVTLKSRLSFISHSPHGKRMLQGTDGGFQARSPAQRAPEPALLLVLGPLGREPSAPRQRHLLHSQGLGLPLVLSGEKTSVAGGHLRRSPEARLMLLEGRHPGRGIVRVAGEHLVPAHDAVSTSSMRTSLPNSLGLCAFPLRMTSVWDSNRLNTLPSTWQFPPHTRSLVCVITFSTKGRKCRNWPICASTRNSLPTTFSRPFAHRCITSLAWRTTPRVSPTNFL